MYQVKFSDLDMQTLGISAGVYWKYLSYNLSDLCTTKHILCLSDHFFIIIDTETNKICTPFFYAVVVPTFMNKYFELKR